MLRGLCAAPRMPRAHVVRVRACGEPSPRSQGKGREGRGRKGKLDPDLGLGLGLTPNAVWGVGW